MNHLNSFFLLSLTLAMTATLARAEPPAETTAAPSGVVEGVAADSSPEMQDQRDELAAKWEADARAAGIDPNKEEAKSDPGNAK